MRKYQRYIIRHRSEKLHGGIEGFRYFWMQFRKKHNLSYRGKRRRSHDLIFKRRKKRNPWKVTETGNRLQKKTSLLKRLVSFIKKLFSKKG